MSRRFWFVITAVAFGLMLAAVYRPG